MKSLFGFSCLATLLLATVMNADLRPKSKRHNYLKTEKMTGCCRPDKLNSGIYYVASDDSFNWYYEIECSLFGDAPCNERVVYSVSKLQLDGTYKFVYLNCVNPTQDCNETESYNFKLTGVTTKFGHGTLRVTISGTDACIWGNCDNPNPGSVAFFLTQSNFTL